MLVRLVTAALVFGLSGCGEEKVVADVPPQSNPSERARMDVIGMKAKDERVALGANNAVHWFKALASGTDLSKPTAFPAQVSRLTAEKRCDVTPPQEGAIVSIVNLYGSVTDTQIFPTTDALIATNVERLLKRSGETMLNLIGKIAIVDPYNLVDVVITETSAPVHLVLSAHDQIIWNIVAAEGVQVSHVTLLGNKDVGVANLSADVPITAFDARMMKKCKIDPVNRPLKTWILARRSKQHFNGYKSRFAQFNAWVMRGHGRYSQAHRVEGTKFSHVLIGPPPQTLGTRVPYRGIGQSHVQMVSNVPIEIMEKAPYARKIKTIATEKAEQMVGMSLADHGRMKKERRN